MLIWDERVDAILDKVAEAAGLMNVEHVIAQLEEYLETVDELSLHSAVPVTRAHYEGMAEGIVCALIELGAPVNSR